MQDRNPEISNALMAIAIGAMALALFYTTPTNGDFWWFDASRHAMNGVFLRDMLLEGGLLHPIKFATDYYAQYPAINIGFYPPFMYISSVPFLALFGASHAVSQSVVALYALASGMLMCAIARKSMDRFSALCVALSFMVLPEIALWSRQVQLDVPAIALLLATAWCLIHYLQKSTSKWLILTAMFLGLSILTRVQAGYAAPAVVLFVLFHKPPQRPPLRVWIASACLFTVLALPAVGSAIYFSKVTGSLAGAMPDMPSIWSLQNWTWYAQALPEQIGWPAVWFIIVGLTVAFISMLRNGGSVPMRVTAAFAISSWLFFTIVSNKEPRFNLPSLPFVFLLAAMGMHRISSIATKVLLFALAVWLCYQALALTHVPVAAGFREASVIAQANTPNGQNVLISAHRDGNFVYDMRTLGNRRDIGIRRADKLFVEIHIMRQLGIKDQNLDENGVRAILDKEKIAVVVSQTGYLGDQKSMQVFQRLLAREDLYHVVGKIKMQGTLRKDEQELLIYARN